MARKHGEAFQAGRHKEANKAGASYTYDANHAHAVAARSDGSSHQYDANGNMTQRVVGGQTFNLGYDAENRLVSVSGPSRRRRVGRPHELFPSERDAESCQLDTAGQLPGIGPILGETGGLYLRPSAGGTVSWGIPLDEIHLVF